MHQLVVASCELVGRLCAYETHGCAESWRDVAAEQIEVEQHLRVGSVVESLQKVGRERRTTDCIVAAVDYADVLYVCNALLYHRFALCVCEERAVFFYYHYVQPFHLLGGLLYEVAMAEGEGVAVHYNAAGGLHCGVEMLRC